MSSVRLTDLRHTTSFRLALLFLALIGSGSLLVFGVLYQETAGFLARNLDHDLARETAVRAPKSSAELKRLLDERAPLDPEGRRPYALFDSSGSWIAGSHAALPEPLPPVGQPFDFVLPLGGEPTPYRGRLHRLASGELLLVAQDMGHIYRFQSLLGASIVSGALVVLVIGLAGGMIAGAGALGRIDAVTRAIERIVDGDLSQRLPSGGRGGDLNRLIQVVNRMLDDIERLMRDVKGVTEDIAHDLRTPLTRLLAGLERARRRGVSNADYEAAIDDAIAEIKEVLATFSALLRIAEVENRARRAGFRALDLAGVAADVMELYEPVAEEKGISLSLEAGGAPAIEIAGDSSLLFEAVSNLVDNAIKYSPAGSRVAVRVLATNGQTGIEVSDTGPGIPEEEWGAVLRRFHRVDKCRGTPGSGLGLSLVAAVARLHDMHLVIEDAHPGCRVVLWRERPSSDAPEPAAIKYG
jgi:signal transduction histidine kinase